MVLLSDFLQGPNGELPNPAKRASDPVFKALDITNRRHDLVCINVYDDREMELPSIGNIVLEDSETGEIIELDTFSQSILKNYNFENKTRMKAFKLGLASIGIDSIEVCTGKPYIVAIRKFFES